MKYVLNIDCDFIIEADSEEEAINKGWDFVEKHFPDCFSTEGSEIQIIGEERE